MGRFFGVEGPVTLPRLTWGTVPFVLIEIIGPARVLRVRGCGKTFGVFQTPAQVGLRVAADVKDSAGVSAQRLVVAPRGLVGPWVPGGAVASNSAALLLLLLIRLLLRTDVIIVVVLTTCALSGAVAAGAGFVVAVAALAGGVVACLFVFGGAVATVDVHCCACDTYARTTSMFGVAV